MRPRRLELPRVLPHSDLNAARLPIPPRPHMSISSVGTRRACNSAHASNQAPSTLPLVGPQQAAKQGLMNLSRDTIMSAPDRLYRPEPVEWRVTDGLTPYEDAVTFMEARAAAIAAGEAGELVWLVEHPALYTAGTSASPQDLVDAGAFPGVPDGSRRAIHLPRPRPAGGLRDAGLEPRAARMCVPSWQGWKPG